MHLQVVIAHRRARGRVQAVSPMPLASIVSGSSNWVSDPRCDSRSVPVKPGADAKPRRRAAHDMLHVHRLALADERAVENGVEDLAARF